MEKLTIRQMTMRFILNQLGIAPLDFFERFEIEVSVIWIIAIFFRMSLLIYVSAKGLCLN